MKLRSEKDFTIEKLYDELDIEMENIIKDKEPEVNTDELTKVEVMLNNIKLIQTSFSIYSALLKADFTLECATTLLEKQKAEHNIIANLRKSLLKRIDKINIYNETQMVDFVELSVSIFD